MRWSITTAALALLVAGVVALWPSVKPSTGELEAASLVSLNPNHECSFCHGVHGAAAGALLNDTVVETLCLTCHGPSGTSTLKADVHLYDNSTCMDCHVAHSNVTNWLGGTNLKLVRDTVVDPMNSIDRPVVFESRGVNNAGEPSLHSFCDGDEDANSVWDGACDTCHTTLGRHNYDETARHSHQQGNTCTRCHEHVLKFKTK